jgi:hypothetical protein
MGSFARWVVLIYSFCLFSSGGFGTRKTLEEASHKVTQDTCVTECVLLSLSCFMWCQSSLLWFEVSPISTVEGK